jgi:hypothetical protein
VPGLPEVETLRRGLSAALPGRRIVSVHVLDHKVASGSPEITGPNVTGHHIDRAGRRGKVLILWLEGSGSLLVHPKMTGQLIVTVAGATVVAGGHPTPSMLEPMPNPTTRAVFRLDQATCLYYNDARRFGWTRLASTQPCATDRRHRQHLRRRVPASRPHPPRPPGRCPHPGRGPPPAHDGPGRPPPRHRDRRHQHRRLPQRLPRPDRLPRPRGGIPAPGPALRRVPHPGTKVAGRATSFCPRCQPP